MVNRGRQVEEAVPGTKGNLPYVSVGSLADSANEKIHSRGYPSGIYPSGNHTSGNDPSRIYPSGIFTLGIFPKVIYPSDRFN